MLSTAHVGSVHCGDARARSRWSGQTVMATLRKERIHIPGFMVLEEAEESEMGDGGILLGFSSSIVVGIAGTELRSIYMVIRGGGRPPGFW